MAEHAHELIIIRRAEEEEHEHHSSAWKVAHADFMTAMMAFFLIMWLINVTDDSMRKGIAQYFNPIHMSQGSTELKGLSKVDPGKDAGAAKRPQRDAAARCIDQLDRPEGRRRRFQIGKPRGRRQYAQGRGRSGGQTGRRR